MWLITHAHTLNISSENCRISARNMRVPKDISEWVSARCALYAHQLLHQEEFGDSYKLSWSTLHVAVHRTLSLYNSWSQPELSATVAQLSDWLDVPHNLQSRLETPTTIRAMVAFEWKVVHWKVLRVWPESVTALHCNQQWRKDECWQEKKSTDVVHCISTHHQTNWHYNQIDVHLRGLSFANRGPLRIKLITGSDAVGRWAT